MIYHVGNLRNELGCRKERFLEYYFRFLINFVSVLISQLSVLVINFNSTFYWLGCAYLRFLKQFRHSEDRFEKVIAHSFKEKYEIACLSEHSWLFLKKITFKNLLFRAPGHFSKEK